MLAEETMVSSEFKEEATNNFDACVESYYHCTSQMLDLLKIVRSGSPSPRVSDPNARYTLPLQPMAQILPYENTSNCVIKLPPCDTEIFHGSYEQWPSFRDMFTAVYINHSKLSPVTKLYHLRNKTRGEAGAIVKRYTLANENFELAWNALKNRYENKRVLVDNQLKLLFDIPSATSENSESIRRIQSSVNDCLATLKTLDVEVDSWDPILIRLISTKLPDFTQKIFLIYLRV